MVTAAIKEVTIHWPGGELEPISAVTLNSFQTVMQGGGRAAPWSPPGAGKFALKPAPLPTQTPDHSTRTWLIGRIPLPTVAGLPTPNGKPQLLSLWFDTCAICRGELAEWTRHASQIRAAGLEGHVLSIDPLLGEEAVATFDRLFDTANGDLAAHREAGILLLQHHLAAPALTHLLAALPASKDDADFRFNLGLAQAANRNAKGALENFQAAATLNPKDAAAHFQIANVLQATKRSREAIGHYREALRLHSGWAFPANNLAWLLATHPDAALRNGAEAVALIEPVTIAEGESNATTLSTLAAALAESGDFERALAVASKALALATKANTPSEIQSLRAALQLYRSSKPMRSP
jgi:tetratricopeptide (TPR) repeat protein